MKCDAVNVRLYTDICEAGSYCQSFIVTLPFNLYAYDILILFRIVLLFVVAFLLSISVVCAIRCDTIGPKINKFTRNEIALFFF